MPDYAQLESLALQRAQDYASRPDTVAVAVTGSIARGTVWPGSDIDLWVFHEGPEAFEDGLIKGIYWEADIRPAAWLEGPDPKRWLEPPPLNGRADGVFEAIWGCRVVHDPAGRLGALKQAIDRCVADRAWLHRRAERFLGYGRGCLAALAYADPLHAIVLARCVATEYGITAYWMGQGRLLTSGSRIPEQLEGAPRLQALYRAVFSLTGQAGAEEMLAALRTLPAAIQEHVRSDVEWEVLPVWRHGCYDGGVRYLRQGMPHWFPPEQVRPVLALEPDLEAQKERVLAQAREILDLALP